MLTSIITIGSQTNALRAQKCLIKANIKSEMFKKDKQSSRGCIYALRVSSNDLKSALYVLESSNISYEI